MTDQSRLTTYALSDLPQVRVHGRSTGRRDPVTLFWTGSGIEMNVSGSELWIEAEAGYNTYEPWISILVNGALVSRQMVTAGRHRICIFRGMNTETVKNVRIVRDVQAMSGDTGCYLQLHSASTDGGFHPVEEKPYRIEFIGDSITSGEGAIGAKPETDWISMWFSAVHNYAAMTAEKLQAEYRILSQSGWGVLTGWDNNPNCNLPQYYEQVCGVLSGEHNASLGAFEPNNFGAWQPDIVVVNLGTNDGGAFNSPAWTDPANGKTYKQRKNEDGSFNEEDLKAFEDAVERFLDKLRRCNPEAQIVWAYGMLGIPMMPSIYRAVDKYAKRTGDKRVSVFQLPNMTEETVGARWHPGALAHEQAAKALSGYLSDLLPNRA